MFSVEAAALLSGHKTRVTYEMLVNNKSQHTNDQILINAAEENNLHLKMCKVQITELALFVRPPPCIWEIKIRDESVQNKDFDKWRHMSLLLEIF